VFECTAMIVCFGWAGHIQVKRVYGMDEYKKYFNPDSSSFVDLSDKYWNKTTVALD